MDSRSPLAGRRIVVTRPLAQSEAFARHLRQLGALPLVVPAIAIAPVVDAAPLIAARKRLADCDAAMFVSANAVTHALAGVVWPDHVRALSTGAGTTKALQQAGVPDRCILQAMTRADSEGLLALPELQNMSGRRVMIFRGEDGRALLGQTLAKRGAQVEYIICYRRGCPAPVAGDLLKVLMQDKLDATTFTASEALQNWETMLEPAALAVVKSAPAFVPHARIADCARSLGWNTILTNSGDEGLIAGMSRYFS